jgi:hypothetical protein
VRSGLLDRPWHQRVKPQIARIDAGKIGGITRDPLSGELQQKYGVYLRLGPPPLPAVPAGGAAACERERVRLHDLLETLRSRQRRAVPPPVRFARSKDINSVATTQIRVWLEQLAGEKARTVAIECREDVCRIHPIASWLPALHHGPEWNERLSGGFRGSDGALYHWIRAPQPPSDQNDMRQFWERAGSSVQPAIRGCADRHTTADSVELIVLFPGSGELNADGVAGKPSLRLRGPSAELSYGRCLRESVTAALASVSVPTGAPAREAKYWVRGTLPAPP